jgi:molybdopterin/thiamine biosynthesis adenylyltransferase
MHSPWFERFPGIFQRDRQLLEAQGFSLDGGIFSRQGKVVFSGRLTSNPDRLLFVQFPNEYPAFPPAIHDDGRMPPLKRHQDPRNRQFCLFGIGSSRWRPSCSASDALQEVESVIALDAGDGASAADDPPEPTTAEIQYDESISFLIPPPISAVTPVSHDWSPGEFHVIIEQAASGRRPARGLVTEVRSAGGESIEVGTAFPKFFAGQVRKGVLFGVPEQCQPAQLRSRVDELLASIPKRAQKPEYWFAFILQEEAGQPGRLRVAWLIVRARHGAEPVFYRAFPYRRDERQARIPGTSNVSGKHVIFVGCGCLGSKISVSLAASGVERMTLVDADLMEPYNAVRHESGVDCFGWPKVQALGNRLITINPALAVPGTCSWFHMQVGSASNNQAVHEQLLQAMREADLVIDTAGSHHVSLWLNEQLQEMGVPCVYASVTNGAWGGEVVRCIPGRSACWFCWFDQYHEKRPSSEPLDSASFFAPGCNQPSFTGTSYETGMVSNLASMMAMEILIRDSTDASASDFSGDYILWNGRDSAGAPALRAEVLGVTPHHDCYLKCGPRT